MAVAEDLSAPSASAPSSGGHEGDTDVLGKAAREQLRGFVQRVERLEEEKANIAADIKEIYAEAKSMGFDTKILRKVVSLRKKEPHERSEEEALLELYLGAIGDL